MAVNVWLIHHFQSQRVSFEDQTNQPTDENMLGEDAVLSSLGKERGQKDLRAEGILASL